jgi:hypothetical protein
MWHIFCRILILGLNPSPFSTIANVAVPQLTFRPDGVANYTIYHDTAGEFKTGRKPVMKQTDFDRF